MKKKTTEETVPPKAAEYVRKRVDIEIGKMRMAEWNPRGKITLESELVGSLVKSGMTLDEIAAETGRGRVREGQDREAGGRRHGTGRNDLHRRDVGEGGRGHGEAVQEERRCEVNERVMSRSEAAALLMDMSRGGGIAGTGRGVAAGREIAREAAL